MAGVEPRPPREVIDMLRESVRRLREVLGDVEVYLFGSYARGDWLLDSDIDLIVVSRGFEGLDLGKRCSLVRRFLPRDRGFDIIAYTPEEFEEARRRSIVIQDAAEYWVRVE